MPEFKTVHVVPLSPDTQTMMFEFNMVLTTTEEVQNVDILKQLLIKTVSADGSKFAHAMEQLMCNYHTKVAFERRQYNVTLQHLNGLLRQLPPKELITMRQTICETISYQAVPVTEFAQLFKQELPRDT
jgi:hypothetical protein